MIKSAQRVLELFEFLDEKRAAITLADVMQRFGYPASSASYLLKSMVGLGYLDYDRKTRTYMPTMRMSVKVSWIEGALFGRGSMLHAMQRLHEVCLETVSLGAQSDLYAQYIHQIPTRLSLPYPRIRQTIRPIARSGLGWLLLSALPVPEVETIIRRINYNEQERSHRVDHDELFERLASIRRDGFVFSRHTVVPGAGFIGMLLPRKSVDARPLALGVNGPVTRLEEKQDSILSTLRVVITAVDSLEGEATRQVHADVLTPPTIP